MMRPPHNVLQVFSFSSDSLKPSWSNSNSPTISLVGKAESGDGFGCLSRACNTFPANKRVRLRFCNLPAKWTFVFGKRESHFSTFVCRLALDLRRVPAFQALLRGNRFEILSLDASIVTLCEDVVIMCSFRAFSYRQYLFIANLS